MKSNTGAKHFKNENKTLNINVNTINVCKNGLLSFHHGTNLIIGGNQ